MGHMRSNSRAASGEVSAGFWQLNSSRQQESCRSVSSNRPTPFIERTDPKIPIMLSANQVPAQVE